MGKVIWKGWSTSADEIPQPLSIIFRGRLKQAKRRRNQQIKQIPEEQKRKAE